MRKIIDEVYMTVNQDLGNEVLVQYSSQIFKDKYGFHTEPKIDREDTKDFLKVGAARYMFIFDDNGQIGTFITLLRDEILTRDKEKEYLEEIEHFRNRILNPDDEFINEVREKTNGN